MASFPRTPFWRNPTVRSVMYQVIVLLILLALGVFMYHNTLENLAERGISTGFGFLNNESGFGIGEVTPLFLPNTALLVFLSSIITGILGVIALSKWRASKGQRIGDETRWAAAAIGLLVVFPAIVLFFTGKSFETLTYTESSSYTIALITGFINTLKVAVLGCVLSTIIGLFVALARLSPNWLLSRLARAYIEINRNIPVLMHLSFWYFIVFQQLLPNVRQSLNFYGVMIVNNRGVYLPRPIPRDSSALFLLSILAAGIAVYFLARYARKTQELTGRQISVFLPSLLILLGIPGLVWLIAGKPFGLEFPMLKGFNYHGGMVMTPEFAALVTGLTIYVSAFNAEIIRSGIQSVSRGQREAALALALPQGKVMRLVILPQSLRVIVPPMISQYLSVTKNSSLAVAIGYPDLVSVGGTILNQTGQAIEVIGLWMTIYLSLSLFISLGMNWYNAKIRFIE